MSEEINTADSGAGAVAPAETPKNDIEAAAVEIAKPEVTEAPEPTADDTAKAEEEKKQAEEKKRNRTKDYISSLQQREAQAREQALQLQQRLEALERRVAPQAKQDGPPQLEDYDYDMGAWQAASVEYATEQATKRFTEQQTQAETQRRLQEVASSYFQRAETFAETHPDFDEVVNAIPYQLHPAVQAAIQAHPSGPELAYHLGNDFDDAFQLASIQPHLASAAVERLVARLSAAPTASQSLAPSPPTPAPKPITQAPAPVPTVGGRSPSETPPEKLTDDEWFKRERERERKR